MNQGADRPSCVRTFIVFTDLPIHVEFRMDLPLLNEGVEMEFHASLRNPKDPKKTRDVDGVYRVSAVKLIYTTRHPSKMGFSQYLEMGLVKRLEKLEGD